MAQAQEDLKADSSNVQVQLEHAVVASPPQPSLLAELMHAAATAHRCDPKLSVTIAMSSYRNLARDRLVCLNADEELV